MGRAIMLGKALFLGCFFYCLICKYSSMSFRNSFAAHHVLVYVLPWFLLHLMTLVSHSIILHDKTYISLQVEVIDEDPEDTEELRTLAQEVVQMFQDVIRLNFKVRAAGVTRCVLY
jgi:hypothetical protein